MAEEQRGGKNNQGSNPVTINRTSPTSTSDLADAFNAITSPAKLPKDSKSPVVGKPEKILEILTPDGTPLTRPPAPDIRRKELESTPPKPIQSFEAVNLQANKNLAPLDPFEDISDIRGGLTDRFDQIALDDDDQWLLDEEDDEPTFPVPRPQTPIEPQVLTGEDVESRVTSEMPIVSMAQINSAAQSAAQIPSELPQPQALANFDFKTSVGSIDQEIKPDLWSNAPQEPQKAQYSTFPPAAPPPEVVTYVPPPSHQNQQQEEIEFIDYQLENLDEVEIQAGIDATNHVDLRPSPMVKNHVDSTTSTPPNSVSYASNFPTDLQFATVQGDVQTDIQNHDEYQETAPPSQNIQAAQEVAVLAQVETSQEEDESPREIEEDSSEIAFAREMGNLLAGKPASSLSPISEEPNHFDWEAFAKEIEDQGGGAPTFPPIAPIEESADAFEENAEAFGSYDVQTFSPITSNELNLADIDPNELDGIQVEAINDENDLLEAQALLQQLQAQEETEQFVEDAFIEEELELQNQEIDVQAPIQDDMQTALQDEAELVQAQIQKTTPYFGSHLNAIEEEEEDSWSSIDSEAQEIELDEDHLDDSFDGSDPLSSESYSQVSQAEEDLDLVISEDKLEMEAFTAGIQNEFIPEIRTQVQDRFEAVNTPFTEYEAIDDELHLHDDGEDDQANQATHPIPRIDQPMTVDPAPSSENLIQFIEDGQQTNVPQSPIEQIKPVQTQTETFEIDFDEEEETDDSWEKKLLDPPAELIDLLVQPVDLEAVIPQFEDIEPDIFEDEEDAQQEDAQQEDAQQEDSHQEFDLSPIENSVDSFIEPEEIQDQYLDDHESHDEDLNLSDIDRLINEIHEDSIEHQAQDDLGTQAFDEQMQKAFEQEQELIIQSQLDDLKLDDLKLDGVLDDVVFEDFNQNATDQIDQENNLTNLFPDLKDVPESEDLSTSPPQSQANQQQSNQQQLNEQDPIFEINLEDLSDDEVPSADEIYSSKMDQGLTFKQRSSDDPLSDFAFADLTDPPLPFDIKLVSLPQPCLPQSFFVENRLPGLGFSPLEKTITPILKTLYQALRQESDPKICATHLMDFASIVYEFLNQSELAYECAKKALALEPKNQWASSLIQRLLLEKDRELLKSQTDLLSNDPEYKHFVGHLLYADGQGEKANQLWQMHDDETDRPIYLPLAVYLSALAQGKTNQAIIAIDDLITNTENAELKAIFVSERIRLIANQGDSNALRSAIFRAVDESGSFATSSLLARMEREALKTNDLPLLLESLRVRLGLNELTSEAIARKTLTSKTKHTGHLLYKLGWLLERNQQSREAFYAYQKANECLPLETFVLLRLIELSRQLKEYQTLRNALKQLAINNKDPQESANLWYQRGLVALHSLKNEEEAKQDFLKAIQLYPTFSSALGALGQIAIKNQDQKSLQRYFSDEIDSLERQLNQKSDLMSAEDDIYKQYLSHTLVRRSYQFARLLQQQMGENEIALTYHLKALSISPQFTPSLLALEEIYEQQGRYARWVHLFEKRLEGEEARLLETDLSSKEQKSIQNKITSLRMAIADLYSTYLQDETQASRHYAKVATFESPNDLYALRKSSESFEKIKEYHSSLLIELRRTKIYKQNHENDQLCLLKAATLQELVGDLNQNAPQALPLYQQAWQNTHHPSALDGLWRTVLYSKQINTLDYYLAPRTISLIGSKALLYLTAETLAVYGQVGRSATLMSLWKERHDHFNDLDERFFTWLENLSLGAEQKKARFEQVSTEDLGWRDYYQRNRAETQIEAMVHDGDWQGANQALMKLAQIVPSAEQAFLWYRMGYHSEIGLKNLEQAVNYYRQALAIDDQCLPAIAALRRISWLNQDWTTYKTMIRRSIQLEDNHLVKQSFWTHLADVVYYVQREEAEAIAYYGKAVEEGLLDISTEIPMPLSLRQRYLLMSQQGHEKILVGEIESYVPRLNYQSKLIAWDWLATLYEVALNQPTQAMTLNRLLLENDRQNTRAKKSVRRYLSLSQDDESYLLFLKSEIEGEPSELDSLALMTRCAHLYEKMGDEKGAERYWRKAFKINSEFIPAYQGIGRSIHKREAWTELVSLYRKELTALPEKSPGKIEILRRLAEIYEYRLGRLSVAATCYEDIIELLPQDPASLSALDRIYCELKQWRSLARVWTTYAQHLKDPQLKGGAFLRVGELYMEEVFAEDEALNAYELAYQANPQLHPAAWAIEMIMYPRNGWGRLIELYRDVRKHLTLPRERQILTHKMILELSSNQIQKALESELFDESDHLEIIWWRVYSSTEMGNSTAQADALLQLARHLRDPNESYALALEAVNRVSKGQPLQVKYRAYWEQLLLINARSRSAWLILMEQAHLEVLQKQDWKELRTVLARMRWVSEDQRQQSSCLWLQGLLERKSGSSRIASDLLKEANEISSETLVPLLGLISYYLTPDDESRAKAYEQLAFRAPIGKLRGEMLTKAAYLRAHDLDQKEAGLDLYIQAANQGVQFALDQATNLQYGRSLSDESFYGYDDELPMQVNDQLNLNVEQADKQSDKQEDMQEDMQADEQDDMQADDLDQSLDFLELDFDEQDDMQDGENVNAQTKSPQFKVKQVKSKKKKKR